MMGGGGSQSSSSSSVATHDSRVGAADHGTAIGGNAVVSVVEPETLRLIAHALPEISGQVFDLAKVVIASEGQSLQRSLDFATKAQQSEDTNTLQQLIRIGGMIAVAAILMRAL